MTEQEAFDKYQQQLAEDLEDNKVEIGNEQELERVAFSYGYHARDNEIKLYRDLLIKKGCIAPL